MSTNTEKELKETRELLAKAQEKLAHLEAKAAEEAKAKKWEPKGGKYTLGIVGNVMMNSSAENCRLAGAEYATKEAAESASKYLIFYQRLMNLAAELNPSGRVGGDYYVWRVDVGWGGFSKSGNRTPLCVFETEEAAEKAAEIMNRDGWSI